MPSIPLHAPRASTVSGSTSSAAIPPLLQTPGGLAIMEMQGHINMPTSTHQSGSTPIGRLVFPEYNETSKDDTTWTRKVYFYIGHQRMLGQVKKLAKPLAVVGRLNVLNEGAGDTEMGDGSGGEQLEILDIVRWKILFNSRPEPVGEGEND